MLRSLIFLIIVVLLSSCAKPPYAELDAAEYMVGKAYALQAVKFAPTEYQAAKAALADARKAIEKTDYSDARDSLEFTLKHARRAAVLAEEGQARAAEEKAQRTLAEEKAQQLALQAAQAEEAAAKSKKTPPKPKSKPAAKPKTKRHRPPTTTSARAKRSGQSRHSQKSTMRDCSGRCFTRPTATRLKIPGKSSLGRLSASVET